MIGSLVKNHRSVLAILAAIVGAICGLASILFQLCIEGWTWVMTGYFNYSAHAGAAHGKLGLSPWFLLFVPIISGLLYGPLIQKWAPTARGHGVPEIMLAVRRKGGQIPGQVALVKIIGSALTLGGGGSVGREGPIAQVGAALGSAIAQRTGLPTSRVVLLAGCGAGAGVAATFNAPLAGALFALEVILVNFTAETFGMAVVASVASSTVAHAMWGNAPIVDLPLILDLPSTTMLPVTMLVGVIAGLGGLLFSKMLYGTESLVDKIYRGPEWARPALGGMLLGIMLFAFPHMFGDGGPIRTQMLLGDYSLVFLLALVVGRMWFTSFTIAIGGSGGVFAPSLFIGAGIGAFVGQILAPTSPETIATFGVIGMGAAFAGAARAPITAVLIIVEMTGQYALILPVMLAVAIAVGVSRFLTRETIYTAKLIRRGDRLDEPVDRTLVGRMSARELMEPIPLTVTTNDTISTTLRLLHSSGETSAVVIDTDGKYYGIATALPLIRAKNLEGARVVGQASLDTSHVFAEDLPSAVLATILDSRMDAVPVLDGKQPIGWISQHALVRRMYREQRRALAAGQQSSWGSRWIERHPGAAKYFGK
ncbi:MAG: chloride channel protein [Actinomycetaceae bacterium]|nr:chloride channel protein [Actinomycetaceae bacterium]